MVAGKFLFLTAWYRASSAILLFGNGADETTPCSSWSRGVVPSRPARAAWARPAAAAARVAVRPPACPLRPRGHGGALAWWPLRRHRRHGPTCQCEIGDPHHCSPRVQQHGPARSSGARAALHAALRCPGPPSGSRAVLPDDQQAGALRVARRRSGTGIKRRFSCPCQPSPVRLPAVRGSTSLRHVGPWSIALRRARRALGALARGRRLGLSRRCPYTPHQLRPA